jgi:hypothetical protein
MAMFGFYLRVATPTSFCVSSVTGEKSLGAKSGTGSWKTSRNSNSRHGKASDFIADMDPLKYHEAAAREEKAGARDASRTCGCADWQRAEAIGWPVDRWDVRFCPWCGSPLAKD